VSKPVFCLSSFEQEGRCHVRIASTVQSRNDNERLFIWCICDQKISHGMKSLWSGSKIGARYGPVQASKRSAALRLSVAMNSQISSRSLKASGWRTNPLINGGDLAAQKVKNHRSVQHGRSCYHHSGHPTCCGPELTPRDTQPGRPRRVRPVHGQFKDAERRCQNDCDGSHGRAKSETAVGGGAAVLRN